jgi:hydantoinase/carbamoylase family amidase
LSAADHVARALFVELAAESGLAVRIDRFGNIWGRTGGHWDQPAVVAGSHLDTVPEGGRFDGVLGVCAALAAVRAVCTAGLRLPVPLGVADFAVEESSRYGISTVGSKGHAGVLAAAEVDGLTDRDGTSFAAALAAHGGYELAGGAPADPGRVGCFLELHVEQGRQLELAGVDLGVVDAIAAPTRFRVLVQGEAAHSGATLMTWRKDGLVAASELVLALERIAELEEEYGTVATATIFALHPVSINVVPGRVELGVDIRGIDLASKRRAIERFRSTVRRVSMQRGITIEVELLADEQPVALHPAAVECVQLGCRRADLPYVILHSRAGHDAMNMARLVPTAMLFVPSRGGVSHHPGEFTPPEQVVGGAQALLHAMVVCAERLGERGRLECPN